MNADSMTGADVGTPRDHWQLAAVIGHAEDTPEWAAALVDATTVPC